VVGAIGLLVGGITSVYLESSKYTRALDKQIKANKQLVDTTDDFIESLQVMGSLKIVDNIDRIGKEINTLKDDTYVVRVVERPILFVLKDVLRPDSVELKVVKFV
jgi:hypothetical protein